VFYARLKAQLEAAEIPAAPPAPRPLLATIERLVVYGLGSLEQPGAVHIRYQAALAVLLAELLPALTDPPEAFDPVFSPLDAAVLRVLGFTVLTADEGGRRLAAAPTLFFMPHCEAQLTDALLEANAGGGTLGGVAILGNSLRQYCDRWALLPRRGTDGAVGATLRALGGSAATVEVPVAESAFPVSSAFNDMGLHTFVGDWRGAWEPPSG
jgi:hypothetical protein